MANMGVVLEARVQRLFMAQGIFAERSLYPAADGGRRLLATDIDVLVSEYASGFHLTRRHAECKSGRKVRVLDRVLWLNGVRAMLGADASYLVVESFNEGATDFARSLSVDVLTVKQLQTWESALNIVSDCWPNRSDFRRMDPIRKNSLNLGRKKNVCDGYRIIREAIQFAEIDSWRIFGYGRLNRLLRILKALSDATRGMEPGQGLSQSIRYAASTLLVRLTQYLLAICYDISRVPLSDIHSYLISRLTFGDQDPERAKGLVMNTVQWVNQALGSRGLTLPHEVDSNRLFHPPRYSDGLIALVTKVINAPHEARYLPIAMETEQFGSEDETERLPRLRSAWLLGRDLGALVKGFAVASLGVDASLLTPIREPASSRSAVTNIEGEPNRGSIFDQSELDLEAS